jgi:hypothetical protein
MAISLRHSFAYRYLATFRTGKQFIPIFVTGACVGTWVRIHDRLREWVRVDHDREPSP